MRLRRYLRVMYGLVGGRCSHLYPRDIGRPPCSPLVLFLLQYLLTTMR